MCADNNIYTTPNEQSNWKEEEDLVEKNLPSLIKYTDVRVSLLAGLRQADQMTEEEEEQLVFL